MITMDMIGKVRRMKWRDQLSDGEICRRTGLARNTVKKWLKAPGDIPPKYERKKADGKLTPFVAAAGASPAPGLTLWSRMAAPRFRARAG